MKLQEIKSARISARAIIGLDYWEATLHHKSCSARGAFAIDSTLAGKLSAVY